MSGRCLAGDDGAAPWWSGRGGPGTEACLVEARRRGEELPAAALQRGLVHIQLHHHYRVRAAGRRSSCGAAHLAALRRGVTLRAAGAQHRLQNKEDPAGEQVGEAADLGHGRAGALPHHHQRCAPCRAATHQAAERHVADWEARAAYYRGAMGILLVYDVTDDASFTNIRNWMRNIEQHASDSVNKARPARRTSAARVACARALPAGPRTEPLPRPASEGSLRRTLAAPCRRSAHTRPGASRLPASALRRRGRGRCWWATSAIWTRVSARCPTARARRWPTSSASSSLRPAPKAT